MRNKIFGIACALVVVLALVVSIFGNQVYPVLAAPPTPQTANASRNDANIATFFNARSITADTRVCADLRSYNKADIQWVINQGTVNTTTLKLQFTIDGVNFVDSAQTVVAANAADSDAMQTFLIYGKSSCILADVTNANPIIITAVGVAK